MPRLERCTGASWWGILIHLRLVVGEYTAATCYDFLLLPVASSVSCSYVNALCTRSSKFPPSPAVSYCLPLSRTRLSLLPNPHPKMKYGTPYSIPTYSLLDPYLIPT